MDRNGKAQGVRKHILLPLHRQLAGALVRSRPISCGESMNLLETYDSLLQDGRKSVCAGAHLERARWLTFGLLVCLRLHLTSRLSAP